MLAYRFGDRLQFCPLFRPFSPLPCSNPNEQALSCITPPPTVRRQRPITIVRLLAMQRELSAESTAEVPTAKVTRLDHQLDGLRAVIAVLVLALTTITCHAQALPDAPSVGILTPFNPTARESVDLNLLRTDALLRVGDFVTTFEFLKNP